MLVMTCDRCGKPVPYSDDKGKGGGRDRWRFGGRDLIVDLCNSCSSIVRQKWLDEIEDWANPEPLQSTS